jgi:hypothetical protein
VAELVAAEAVVELAPAVDAALRAVESRFSRSSWDEVRSPFSRSLPNWLNSLTKDVSLLCEDVTSESRLAVRPLEDEVAVEEVTPFSASSDSVT